MFVCRMRRILHCEEKSQVMLLMTIGAKNDDFGGILQYEAGALGWCKTSCGKKEENQT